jgi:hypothetical protein
MNIEKFNHFLRTPFFNLDAKAELSEEFKSTSVDIGRLIKEREILRETIREELKQNEEYLKQKSLLSKIGIQDDLDSLFKLFQTDEFNPSKALAVTNLSFSVRNTGYQGWSLSSTAKLYSTILKLEEKNHTVFANHIPKEKKQFMSAILRNLSQLEQTNMKNIEFGSREHLQEAKRHMQHIQKLLKGESYCMDGGWLENFSGHAMIYRFERISDQTFNIYIYNAQTELQNGGKEEERRKKCHPYVLFKDVTWEELFFSNPNQESDLALFKHLVGLNINEQIKKKMTSENVWACFHHIAHRRVATSHLPHLFISIQQSGNCVIKTTNCMLLDEIYSGQSVNKLDEAERFAHASYKKLSLDIRLFTIIAYYQIFKENYVNDPLKCDISLVQLREAGRNFLRVLDANFNRPYMNIGKEEYATACATIQDMLQKLNETEKQLASQLRPALSLNLIEAEEVDKLKKRLTGMHEIAQTLKVNQLQPSLTNRVTIDLHLGEKIDWHQLPSVINILIKKTEAFEKETENDQVRQALFLQIETTLRNLSHLKNTPCSLSQPEAYMLLSGLVSLQDKYNQNVFACCQEGHPSVKNTAMEFLALAYSLAVAADQHSGILQNYGLYTQFFDESTAASPLFAIQDPILLDQRNALQSFFAKHHSCKAVIFDFNTFRFQRNTATFFKSSLSERLLYGDYLDKEGTKRDQPLTNFYRRKMSQNHLAFGSVVFNSFASLNSSQSPPQFQHLNLLKKSSIFAHEACNRGDLIDEAYRNRRDVTLEFDQVNFTIRTSRCDWNTGLDKEKLKNKYQSDDCRYFDPLKQLKPYITHPQASRYLTSDSIKEYGNQELIQAENALLTLQSKDDSDLPFYLALSAPQVQTSLLLDAMENNLELLSTGQIRLLLNHMLIKMVEQEDQFFSPLIDSLKKEPKSIARFERLVTVGKRVFIDAMPEEKPRLMEMLFLVRQYARALSILRSLYPDYTYSQQTFQLIQTLNNYFTQALQIPKLEKSIADEIFLARSGLMLSIPADSLSLDQQADLFHAILDVKQCITKDSILEDRNFLFECQRTFFMYEDWFNSCQNPEYCKKLAVAILRPITEVSDLDWKLEGNCLKAAAYDQIWEIDLKHFNISNQAGSLIKKEPAQMEPKEFNRLFQNRQHSIQVFGHETWFQDRIWGQIKISQMVKGETSCQRQIGQKWYTYVPLKYYFRVKVSRSLFENHAIWFDADHPSDIRFCDLKTGEERYYTDIDGRIYDAKGRQFSSPFSDNPFYYKLLIRFEMSDYIDAWIDPSGKNLLEFTGSNSPKGKSLSFQWDSQAQQWFNTCDPEFIINVNPDKRLGFEVDHFLPLISRDKTKEKWLIPFDNNIKSAGYNPKAMIKHDSNMEFFEYTPSTSKMKYN